MAKVLTKTANDAIQELASGVMATGSARDVSGSYGTRVFIDYAPTAETAATAGARAVVQISGEASGDEFWTDYYEFSSALNTAASEALSNIEAVGSTVLEVVSTVGFTTLGEKLFLKNGTLGNSEWARLKTYSSNVSITLFSGLTREQAAGTVVYTKAERWSCPLPIDIKRYRVIMFAPTGPTGVFMTYDETMAL